MSTLRQKTLRLSLAALGARFAWNKIRRAKLKRNFAMPKVFVITGGSSGLGLSLAQTLLKQGHQVAICGRNTKKLHKAQRQLLAMAKNAAQVDQLGERLLCYPCDVSEPQTVKEFIQAVLNRFQHIDVLINNAGIIQVAPYNMLTKKVYQDAMDTMFWGTLNVCQEVLPGMVERKQGHIVNINSIGGEVPVPHLMSYCAAKFANQGFSKSLSAEVRSQGLHVTTVVPGLMRTGSFLNARIGHPQTLEFSWFSLLSSLPILSVSNEKATRKILKAIEQKQHHLVIGVPAKILRLTEHLFPELTSRLLMGLNMLLPHPPKSAQPGQLVSGKEILDHDKSKVPKSALGLGLKAAKKYQNWSY